MEIRHYYHCYAAGAWAQPVREHIMALGWSRFGGDMTVGLTGPPADRGRAREMILLQLAEWDLPLKVSWVEADEGFEQVTLAAIHRDIHKFTGEQAILYAHTKGARDDSQWNAFWRRSMTARVVADWRSCAEILAGDHDTVGCHWLTPAQHHDPPDWPVNSPFYGGNFWWARASYLRKLPLPLTEHRFHAEEWVGLAGPRAYDLLPGWPSMELCAPGQEITDPVRR